VADDDAYNDADYNSHFAALQAVGIPIILDNRSSLMHNKFFVIDGLIVWTGSTNITNTGFTYNHNNSLVFTSTELADIYETEFDEWAHRTRAGEPSLPLPPGAHTPPKVT
jgi:phosphatidylserine/phosphatidylglycerophosphate/cardiolipin synthase-like enzyme